MTKAAKQDDTTLVTQEHCIDLPGESVQCWIGGGTDKLKVILRKHRDVIFDFKLGHEKSYSVESTESDYYNVRDKKIVLATQRNPVKFADGERLHLWVSRGFRGALVVKCDEEIIAKVQPNQWDQHQYGQDPKQKPAPIIISFGQHISTSQPTAAGVRHKPTTGQVVPNPAHASFPITTLPYLAAAPLHEEDSQIICVLEGNAAAIPRDILEYFEKGGDGSGFSKVDPVWTRNWIWGAVAGGAAYVKDNWSWLKASVEGNANTGFKFFNAKVHYVRGKVRFYFSGYKLSNTEFGRGGFGPGNERIMTIFAGVGKTGSVFKSTVVGVAGTFKANALVSFIFGAATSIAEWAADVKKDGYDLAAALLMTTFKAILGAALSILVVAAIVIILMLAFGMTLSVLMVGSLSIIGSVVMGYLVEKVDKKVGVAVTGDENNTDGIASIVAPWLRKASESISNNWYYLASKMPKDYSELNLEGP